MSNEIIEAKPQEVVQMAAFNVEALITKAVEKKVSVDTMERILAMRRELKAEFAKAAFDSALAKFQSECPTIEKKKQVFSKDGKPRYKYAPLETIVEQVREPLKNNGFSYSIDAEVKERSVKAKVKAVHELGHFVESSFEVPIDPESYMNAPQRFASALTFAKRYAFCNVFGIMSGDEDDDAVSAEEIQKKPSGRAVPAVPAKPATLSAITLDFINKLGKTTTVDEYNDISAAINEAKNSKAISQAEYTAILNAAKQAVRRIEDLKTQPPVIEGPAQESAVSEEDIEQIAKDVGLV